MFGKNIFIGFIVVIILLIIILFTFQIQQYNFYKQFETTKQVQDWVIENIKNKDKSKLKLIYCIDPMPNLNDYNKYLDSAFEMFWENVKILKTKKVRLEIAILR